MSEKLYYSMGEVAEMFDVNQSLIRHWESQFSVLRPKRNKKGNRLFSPQDVEHLKTIYHLVKECGMTLEGAKRAMRGQRGGKEMSRNVELMERLQRIRSLLSEVREELKAEGPAWDEAHPDGVPDGVSGEGAVPDGEPSGSEARSAREGSARRRKAVVRIDEATGQPEEDPDPEAAGQPKRKVRKPRRKREEVEHKELFAFYEQSLF